MAWRRTALATSDQAPKEAGRRSTSARLSGCAKGVYGWACELGEGKNLCGYDRGPTVVQSGLGGRSYSRSFLPWTPVMDPRGALLAMSQAFV